MQLYKLQRSLPARSCRRQSAGFTIIELMIVMVIVAIGVSLAVPTFRSITEKRQLTSAAESVAAFMTLAQSAAVKYDQDVMVNMQRTNFNTWCVGAILGATPCDCMENVTTEPDFCAINGVPRRIQHADVISNVNYQLLQSIIVEVAGVETTPANSNVIFDPVTATLLVPGTLLIPDKVSFEMHTNTGAGSDKEYQLNVNVLPTGNVSICTDIGRKLLLKMFPTCS